MARLYFDNDVSLRLVPMLEEARHAITTSVELGLTAAGDEVQLLTAVQRQEIFITSNRHDFMMLHRAWLLWPSAFGFTLPTHPGIVVMDQAAPIAQFKALHALLSGTPTDQIPNQMLWWHAPIGWRRLAGLSWLPFSSA